MVCGLEGATQIVEPGDEKLRKGPKEQTADRPAFIYKHSKMASFPGMEGGKSELTGETQQE